MADLVNQLGPEVTGREGADQDEFLRRLEALETANKTKEPGQQYTQADIERILSERGAASQPELKIKVFGQEHSFKTLEELSAAVEASLAQRPAQQTPQQQVAVAAPPPEGFADEKFEELLKEKDPRKALEYALRHSDLGKELAQLRHQNEVLVMRETARDVKEAIPGFRPKDPREIAVVESYLNRLGGSRNNPESWRAAVILAANDGHIKLEAPETRTVSREARHENTQAPPPYLGGTAAEPVENGDVYSRLMNLPFEQLEVLKARNDAKRQVRN